MSGSPSYDVNVTLDITELDQWGRKKTSAVLHWNTDVHALDLAELGGILQAVQVALA